MIFCSKPALALLRCVIEDVRKPMVNDYLRTLGSLCVA
jgi:hypothetical protein